MPGQSNFQTVSNLVPDWAGTYGALTGKGDAGFWGFGSAVRPDTGPPALSDAEKDLLARNAQLFGEQQQTLGRQNQLSGILMGAAQGQGPSYAGQQLGAGLDQIQRNALNAAAGAGGNNGVLARYAAMNTAANAGAEMNQQAALARTNEINQARALLGQNLGQTQQSIGNIYGSDISGFTGQRSSDVEQQKNANDAKQKLLGTGLNMGASFLAA